MKILLLQPWYFANGHPFASTNALVDWAMSRVELSVWVCRASKSRQNIPSNIKKAFTEFYNFGLPILHISSSIILGLMLLFCRRRYAKVIWLDCDPVIATIFSIIRSWISKEEILVSLLQPPARISKFKVNLIKKFAVYTDTKIMFFSRTKEVRSSWVMVGLPEARIVIKPSPINNPKAVTAKDINLGMDLKTLSAGTPPRFRLLVFGQLRPEKSIDKIIEAVVTDGHFELIVAGPCINDRYLAHIKELASDHRNIKILDCFLSTNEVEGLFASADFTVLLYTDSWGKEMESGVLIESANYQVPSLSYADGWIGETISNFKNGVTIPRKDSGTHVLLDAIKSLSVDEYADLVNGCRRLSEAYSLDKIGPMYISAQG